MGSATVAAAHGAVRIGKINVQRVRAERTEVFTEKFPDEERADHRRQQQNAAEGEKRSPRRNALPGGGVHAEHLPGTPQRIAEPAEAPRARRNKRKDEVFQLLQNAGRPWWDDPAADDSFAAQPQQILHRAEGADKPAEHPPPI